MKLEKWRKYLENGNDNVISFIPGTISDELVTRNFKIIKKIVNKIFSKKSNFGLITYASCQGNFNLRKIISEELMKDGVSGLKPENILITNGGQQGLKIVIECVLKENDVILVEPIGYIGIEKPLLDRKVKIETLPKSVNYMNDVDLEKLIVRTKPKLLFLIPDFSNPTGETINNQKRRLLGKLSQKYNFWIAEDRTYSELYFKKENKLAPIAKYSKNVIVIGSISKAIISGLRIGWLVVRNKKLMNSFLNYKESIDLSTSSLDQEIVCSMMNNKKVMKNVGLFYAEKMKVLVESMEMVMPKGFDWEVPKGGYYLWVKGPRSFDMEKMQEKAIKNGVNFVPGAVFYFNRMKKNTFRMSVGNISGKNIVEGVKRLAEIF